MRNKLFLFPIGTAFVIFAATAANMSADQQEYAQENKTIGDKKEIVKISDAEKCGPGEEADHTAKHQ